MFNKFSQYIKDTRIKPEHISMDFETMKSLFQENKAAIMRGTASDCAVIRETDGINAVMLPYFGETSEDNWLLTYPTCQVAVNKAVEQDKKKTDAVIAVLNAMFSEEGQRHVATGSAVLSYNKNVNIELSDVFSQVKDCVDSNHLYIRLASTEMFAVSRCVVHKMIRGEYGVREAYDDFNSQLTAAKNTRAHEIVTTQKTGYNYAFGEHGSPAASAVVNTMRKKYGSEIAVGYSSVVTAPVFEGDYTRQQLNWLAANRLVLRNGSLTGAELEQLMEWLVNVKEDGSNPIRHDNLIPVTSGMEYKLTDNDDGTYTLGKITINGKPIDGNKTYSVIMIGDNDYIEAPYLCNCPMPQELADKMEVTDKNVYTLFNSALEGGIQLETPTEYVTVTR